MGRGPSTNSCAAHPHRTGRRAESLRRRRPPVCRLETGAYCCEFPSSAGGHERRRCRDAESCAVGGGAEDGVRHGATDRLTVPGRLRRDQHLRPHRRLRENLPESFRLIELERAFHRLRPDLPEAGAREQVLCGGRVGEAKEIRRRRRPGVWIGMPMRRVQERRDAPLRADRCPRARAGRAGMGASRGLLRAGRSRASRRRGRQGRPRSRAQRRAQAVIAGC